jgi:hypothetical protein
MVVALVVMCGFASCSDDCNHDYIEVDYSNKLAGIWTCLEAENDYAEALIFNADGTITSTGVFEGEYWEKKGTYKIKGNQMTLSFEDGDYIESRFEMVEGEVFALVDDKLDVRYNYHYCENDLSDEIVGMWVFQDGESTTIQTFTEDGKLITTASASDLHPENLVQQVSEYKVVDDLRFHIFLDKTIEHRKYLPARLVYTPKGTAFGDIMSVIFNVPTGNGFVETTSSSLRVKQNLNLTGKKYAYKQLMLPTKRVQMKIFL